MVENFCKDLWSDQHQGNEVLGSGPAAIEIQLGRTPLDYDAGYEHYLRAVLEARKRLPADFRQVLERERYFDRLRKDLARAPREFKVPSRILAIHDERAKRDLLWYRALEVVSSARMEKRFPGFLRQERFNLPEEWRLASIRGRDELRAELFRAVWLDSPSWKRLVEEAEVIRSAYIRFIDEKLSLPNETKTEWIKRLRAVKFVAPGTVPARSDRETGCAAGLRNAYYHGDDHSITICSGYFSRWDLLQSLPHELTHALKLSPSLGDPVEPDPLTRSFSSLMSRTCSEKKLTCEEWGEWKKSFSVLVPPPAQSARLIEGFQSCINGEPIKKVPSTEKLEQIAQDAATDFLENEASQGGFLFMIAPDRGDLNGKRWKNPSYMNPCGLWPWPVDPPLRPWNTIKTFFVNEYRCSSQNGTTEQDRTSSPADRRANKMKSSIEEAKRLVRELYRKSVAYEGKYSASKRMQAEGFAKDIEERLADRLGREVGAFMLEQDSDPVRRRELFLAGIASFCDPPSLQRDFPAEFQVQKTYYFDGHAESDVRRREALIEPIRKALGCVNDVAIQECSLGLEVSRPREKADPTP